MNSRLATRRTGAGRRMRRSAAPPTARVTAAASALLALVALLPAVSAGAASSDHPIYVDALSSNWRNWSWSSTVDFAGGTPYAGSRSLSWRIDKPWAGLYLHSGQTVQTTDTTSLTFALRASSSDQRVTVSLYGDGNQQLAKPRPLSQLGGDPRRATGGSTTSR